MSRLTRTFLLAAAALGFALSGCVVRTWDHDRHYDDDHRGEHRDGEDHRDRDDRGR